MLQSAVRPGDLPSLRLVGVVEQPGFLPPQFALATCRRCDKVDGESFENGIQTRSSPRRPAFVATSGTPTAPPASARPRGSPRRPALVATADMWIRGKWMPTGSQFASVPCLSAMSCFDRGYRGSSLAVRGGDLPSLRHPVALLVLEGLDSRSSGMPDVPRKSDPPPSGRRP
jgi:hypothetical protein